MRKAASFRRSMTRRFVGIALALAVGLLALGGLNARAGTIPLPTTVDNLAFSAATYTVNPVGSPPDASAVSAIPFTSVPGEPGIQFNGSFTAAAGQTVDYAITYTVMTTDGGKISDAFLSLGGLTNNGGTGSVSIGETIANSSGTVISKVPFQVFTPTQSSDTTPLTPSDTTIHVEKDITVRGGSNGATQRQKRLRFQFCRNYGH